MNRIQRARRFRLATLVLTLGAVLAVSSLPAASPTYAAPGDTMKIRVGGSSTYAAGPAGSTFTARVSSNTVTPMGGIQTSVTFDNQYLEVTGIARVAGFWGSATVPADGSNVATSNANGKVATWAAAYFSTPGSPTGTDVPFLDVTFRVKACPASDQAGQLLLPIGPADNVLTAAVGGTSIDPEDPASTPASPIPGAYGATITCTPPAANEFSLSASQTTLTVPQGGTGATNITATLTSGNAELVTLAATGVPVDVSATFGSTTVTPTAGTSLTFNVGVAAVVGSYTVVVSGTSTSVVAPGRTVNVTLVITPPPAGPTPATGSTTVSGTVDAGFLGVSVDPATQLRLRRNAPDETSIPVLVFSNTQWTLSIEDAMLNGKAASDRGRMLDTLANPQKRLSEPMQAYVPVVAPAVPLVRTLDVAGAQSLQSGTLNATVGVTISQLTKPIDPPGNYAIDLLFSAISGF